jgi:branched-subunit amino acid aminotransferase/4-amino-4-deoxychorismate lyase
MPGEIKNFKEAFFTGTAAEVTAIWSISLENWEKISFSSGEEDSLTNKIKKIYLDVVSWKNEKYSSWLS